MAFSQQPATPATTIESSLQQKIQLAQTSPVKSLPFKSIGPTIMSGRVVDFAVNPNNPTEFYVGYGAKFTNQKLPFSFTAQKGVKQP